MTIAILILVSSILVKLLLSGDMPIISDGIGVVKHATIT
jgi:hypothetical protein